MAEQVNPAVVAAERAWAMLKGAIDANQSFIFEAGAGAGKTYSLIEAVNYLIDHRGRDYARAGQKIACITYTNVAKDEIISRTDQNPTVAAETIHGFFWPIIRPFQTELREILPTLGRWEERIAEQGELGTKPIIYDLGYPRISDTEVSLYHDDVPALAAQLFGKVKFQRLFTSRFPVLFIDEYQDTNRLVVDALSSNFLDTNTGPLIGFFGDHWQKIYGRDACGLIEHDRLVSIGKEANFRSTADIVAVLSEMRPELPQAPKDPESAGSIVVYHSNNWEGERRKGNHWKGDLPAETARAYLESAKDRLTAAGWDFAANTTKVLMLTHAVLADEQGYSDLVQAFDRRESLLDLEDATMSFLVQTLEPALIAYERNMFGEMFKILAGHAPRIRSHAQKTQWVEDLNALIDRRNNDTILDVLTLLRGTQRPKLPEAAERRISSMERLHDNPDSLDEDTTRKAQEFERIGQVPYRQVTSFAEFINELVPYKTQHSVKGAEYENVLVVLGRGWNQYNFSDMLEWWPDNYPDGKDGAYERARNLFYVACSRPKTHLALLFTQELSDGALETLATWFGDDRIEPL